LASHAEHLSTLEADLELLTFGHPGSSKHKAFMDLKLSPHQRSAVVYRSERKKILRSQLLLVAWLRTFLDESYKVRSLMSLGAPQEDIDKAYKSIYLSYMAHECDQVDDKGEFKNEDDEHEYQFRRLLLREYFLQIYQSHQQSAI